MIRLYSGYAFLIISWWDKYSTSRGFFIEKSGWYNFFVCALFMVIDMSRVAIVTDSTAYLPSDYIEKYKMRVVHLLVVCEDETFRDGVDILPED
jgi:hypothetical protein